MNIPKDKFEALVQAGYNVTDVLGAAIKMGRISETCTPFVKAWDAAIADIRTPEENP